MDIYGYARVSSDSQNLTRQLEELRAFGIEDKYIFCDKASGKDFDRKAYNSLTGTDSSLVKLSLVIVSPPNTKTSKDGNILNNEDKP